MPESPFQESVQQRNDQRRNSGLDRRRRMTVPRGDGWIEIDGVPLRDFGSNDYLGLAGDPRVVLAARETLDLAGCGSASSALICGRTKWHEELEARLAGFEQTETCLLFPSGYAANVGTLTALIDSTDTVFCERLNHSSLVDGCRLSAARFRVYRSSELEGLERELKKSTDTGRRWIVTDSVFSMDGTLAPLSDLCDLAERFGADIIIDEAHATGVFGKNGRGVAELTGTEDRIAVRVGTLSKAVGTAGGFVAGSKELIELLWNSARTQMFSTALPASICAAATASLDIIQNEPERRERLHRLSELFRSEIERHALGPVPGSTGPIVPVIVGNEDDTLEAAALLQRQQFFVGAIRPPTVPARTSRLRIALSTRFGETDVRALSVAVARSVGDVQMRRRAE